MRFLVGFTLLVLFILSCSDFSPSETKAELSKKNYFDIVSFFEKEKERLSENEHFVKITSVNGISEKREVAQIDLEKELNIFSKSDINRPAWSDKYSVDSLFNDGDMLTALHYETLDAKLRTHEIRIEFKGGEVSKIKIKNRAKTTIADNEQSLLYEPSLGYSIESRQKVRTIDKAVLRVEVKF